MSSAELRSRPLIENVVGTALLSDTVTSAGRAEKVALAETPARSVTVAVIRCVVSSPWSSNGSRNSGPLCPAPGWSWHTSARQCTAVVVQVTGSAPSSGSTAVAVARTSAPTANRPSGGGGRSVRTGAPLAGATRTSAVPPAPCASVTVSRAVNVAGVAGYRCAAVTPAAPVPSPKSQR